MNTWEDGTPRSMGNAFDWKNYEPTLKWVEPNKFTPMKMSVEPMKVAISIHFRKDHKDMVAPIRWGSLR